jgi:ribosome-binding factor A
MRGQSLVVFGEDDAEDFALLQGSRGTAVNGKENRKAMQLCRQVAETLDLVLSGDCREELLQSLHVVSVVPAPNASRLLVTLDADLPTGEFDPRAILALLDRQQGRLRAEVAVSIHRKRVPTLAFQVLGPDS